MRMHVLAVTASVVVLVCGALSASAQAQAPSGPSPGMTQQSPAENQDGYGNRGGLMVPGMMGRGMMGPGMMSHGMMSQGRTRGGMGPGNMGPMMMRMMFALVDADGDGKISLQEFQAAHERIFKAMDANKDGFVTLEEMQSFIRGAAPSAPAQ